MPIFGEKPVTSITIKINQLSTPHRNDEIDESIELYLSDLLHLIELQPSTGATEAARAVRKKIKYGDSVEQQLRALSVLELLILNSGKKIGPVIARDDKLLDVLKSIIDGSGKTGSDTPYDKEVQSKVRGLARGWKYELEGMDQYKYLAMLWKSIPGAKKKSGSSRSRSASNVFGQDDDDNATAASPRTPVQKRRLPVSDEDDYYDDENSGSRTPPARRNPPPRPKTASPYANTTSKKDKKKKKKKRSKRGIVYADEQYEIPQINYKVEAPRIRTTIADCYTHTTALSNLLITLPKDVLPLDDKKTRTEFEKCRSIRRKVLRYLQYVGAGDESGKSAEVIAMDEEFLGSLIGANDQLVTVFNKFETASGYSASNPAPEYDDETDSDESYYSDESSEEEEDSIAGRLSSVNLQENLQEGPSRQAKSPPPPRPAKPAALLSPSRNAAPEPLAPPIQTKPNLDRNNSVTTVESDPFGDSYAANTKSVYYWVYSAGRDI